MRNKIIILVVALAVAGGYLAYADRFRAEPEAMPADSVGEMEETMESDSMEKNDSAMMTDDSAMMPVSPAGEDSDAMLKFSGTVLAGTASPLLDFNKQDFDKALASDKLIVVYFYANWCPICKAEFTVMQEVFNEASADDVIGFRVNYNDNETNSDEAALAREHGVAYQHTKVFLKNGTRVLKSPESWEKSRYLEEINKAL